MLNHEVKSIIDRLLFHAQASPEKIAFQFYHHGNERQRQLSYRELLVEASALATKLLKTLQPGDRAILMYPPGLSFVVALYACLLSGIIAVPVMPALKGTGANRVNAIIKDCNASIILCDKTVFPALRLLKYTSAVLRLSEYVQVLFLKSQKKPYLQIQVPVFMTDKQVAANISTFTPKDNDDAIAFLQYTSGSTGNPKGVIVKHKNIIANLRMQQEAYGMSSSSTIVNWAPHFHDLGLIAGIFLPVYLGASSVLMSPLEFIRNPLSWLQLLSISGATHTGGPSFAYEYCYRKITDEQAKKLKLSAIEVMMSGAETINIDALEKFYDKFKVSGLKKTSLFPSYGLAEATLLVSAKKVTDVLKAGYFSKSALERGQVVESNAGVDSVAIACSGTPLTNVYIADPNTFDSYSEDGRVGEVVVQGENVAEGYWCNPENTNRAFVSEFNDISIWTTRTGDLGFLYHGELYITGRLKDLIIINGANYYPQDFERLIYDFFPEIRPGAAAAFSVYENRHENLVIVCEVYAYIEKWQHQKLASKIRNKLMREFQVPVHQIVLIKEKTIPKTSSGKIRRNKTKEKYLEDKLETVTIFPNKTVNNKTRQQKTEPSTAMLIVSFICGKTGFSEDSIKINEPFLDIGLDSITMMDIFNELSNIGSVKLDPASLDKNVTIARIADMIDKHADIEQIKKHLMYQSEVKVVTDNVQPIGSFNSSHRFLDYETEMSLLKKIGIENLFFQENDGIATNKTIINGNKCINFASYNYLGLSGDRHVSAAAIEAIKQYGTSVSASRVVSGEKPVHKSLERAIAALVGTEDAITFVGGHATNIATITSLVGQNDLVLLDEISHNSLVLGAKFSGAQILMYKHNNVHDLERLLKLHRDQYQSALIVTEGIFSMDGDIPNLPAFIQAKKKYKAMLMVDEAHSIGVLGETGRGVVEHFQLKSTDIDVLMGTLSKALASCGGYIAGTKQLVDFLKRKSSGFVFSVGMPPASAAAALAAIEQLIANPEKVARLQENASYLHARLLELGVKLTCEKFVPIIPIVLGETHLAIMISKQLLNQGLNIPAIFYPAVPERQARLRLFINALHNQAELDETAKKIADALSGHY